ncbi:FecR family protein [Spirosoma knui]
MTTQEFIENESFRRWVFLNTPNETIRWETYLTQHPDYRESAEMARTFLLTAKGELPEVTDQQINEAVEKILSTVPSRPQGILRTLSSWSPSFQVAASVALLMVVSWLGWRFWPQNQRVVSDKKPATVAPASVAMTEFVNQQRSAQLVRLADGSLVVLQPHARIRFPKQFNGPKRDVYLTGKAFFEVVRNPDRPFRVFTKEVTTEVVGTSFLVNAPETGNVNVIVKTGKVAVTTNPAYTRKRPSGQQPSTDANQSVAVVLLPNQQATFSQNNARLVKREVSPVEATVLPATTQDFTFRRTPLPVVLDALAKAYGIPIQYDREALSGCTLTAQLDDPSLFARLDVITASTGSMYELQNGQLIIHSSGCQ